jgi:molybdate transport system regulatory protein
LSEKKRSVHCKSRLRILSGDLIALGPGKVDLLESIKQEGSISQAARERHLSYRRAWNMVDTMNQCFKDPLVTSITGGKGGGGAKLTLAGEKVIQLYREMENKADTAILKEWETLEKLLLRTDRNNEK